jgi:hypothetical protein
MPESSVRAGRRRTRVPAVAIRQVLPSGRRIPPNELLPLESGVRADLVALAAPPQARERDVVVVVVVVAALQVVVGGSEVVLVQGEVTTGVVRVGVGRGEAMKKTVVLEGSVVQPARGRWSEAIARRPGVLLGGVCATLSKPPLGPGRQSYAPMPNRTG